MKKQILIFIISISGIVVLQSNGCGDKKYDASTGDAKESTMDRKDTMQMVSMHSPAADLRTDMRKLWEDHVIWTRNVIINILDKTPGGDEATERLLQNQDDIGDAIKPYYGNDAGEKLSQLLRMHITTAADLLKALAANNKDGVDAANKKWEENADEICSFLAGANPNWDEGHLKMMMHQHLKLTTDEASARKDKKYDDDVKAFDKVHNEILDMSDMLTKGIIEQFPDKFMDHKMAAMEK